MNSGETKFDWVPCYVNSGEAMFDWVPCYVNSGEAKFEWGNWKSLKEVYKLYEFVLVLLA